jgi:hypothetical protein
MAKYHQRSALLSTSNIIGEKLCNTHILVTLLNHASQWKLSWDFYVMHATPLTINRSNLCGWEVQHIASTSVTSPSIPYPTYHICFMHLPSQIAA